MNNLMHTLRRLILSMTLCLAAWAAESAITPTAPYLLPDSPTFDLSITQFREKFNAANPEMALNGFRSIFSGEDHANLIRAATKINENLYASVALEGGTLKIKSMHITWLPVRGDEQKAAKACAEAYMAALLRLFTKGLSRKQSKEHLLALLAKGKHKRYYEEKVGAIRYIVADNGEKGLTFAIEPIKLTLSDAMRDTNK